MLWGFFGKACDQRKTDRKKDVFVCGKKERYVAQRRVSTVFRCRAGVEERWVVKGKRGWKSVRGQTPSTSEGVAFFRVIACGE